MADTKKPFEEVSAEDAQAMFANAAKALGGSQGRSAGFRRVSIPVSEPVRPSRISSEDEYDDYDERYDFGATTVIPGAVVFDYSDDYDEEYDDEDYEPTSEEIEEEVAFSALEQALNRHKEVYGDTRKGRRSRYHDYGFGMGISFDGPDAYEDDEDY